MSDAGSRERTTKYEIVDRIGRVVAIHVRVDRPDGDKRVFWQLPDGTPGLGGAPLSGLPLYGLPRLGVARPGAPVYVCEGEKAADALHSVGLLAIGTVTGASAIPDDESLSVLARREVRLWPDNDPIGRLHMGRIYDQLVELGASPGIVDWGEAPEHGDAADFVAGGNSELDALALPIRSAPLEVRGWAESIRGFSDGASIRSAQRSTLRGAERILPFQTAREFARSTQPTIDWIARPWVAPGSITGIDGKIKAAGKTTLATYLARAVVDGREFLGEPTRRTGVVYLSEQPGTSLREALRRADLLDRDDFAILSWRDCAGIPWPEVVETAVRECRRRSAGLLVVDTLSRFAGITGDGENDAGRAEEAMGPLQLAAAGGLAVIVTRHERKAGGDVGDSGRGSTAFGGAVDIILALRRTEGNPAVRRIHALSRFDETPDSIVVELTADGYVVVGDDTALAVREAEAKLRDLLPSDQSHALPMRELQRLTGASRTTIQRALDALIGSDDAALVGSGRKGNPFAWWAPGLSDPEGGEFMRGGRADASTAGSPVT